VKRRAVLALAATASAQVAAGPSTFASDWDIARMPRRGRPAPLPPGYALIGSRLGVPPLVLYGVALQESAKLFGQEALPWPWTLNVRGEPKRYANYAEAIAGMTAVLDRGITNVDAGLMQVNWGFHRKRLQHPARALDPYPNITTGALILLEQYRETGNWFTAVGRYHSPANEPRARNYATLVYRRIAQIPQGLGAASEVRRG
jgi:soluble lytic murein transglycosylase-like protein